MRFRSFMVVLVAATCTSLFGQAKPSRSIGPSGTRDRPMLHSRDQRYQRERGDVFDLDFALTPEFNQAVTFQPDGYISLRSVGDIRILSQTIPEASATIRTAYA